MKNRLLLLSFFSLLSLAQLQAQDPVKFINTGELMSTPRLSEDDYESTLIIDQVGEDDAAEIFEYAEEATWPEGISTLTARNANRPVISEYRAFVVADLANAVVLIIPPSENKHMPANMQPTHNIYFVINDAGIEDGDSYTEPEVEIADFGGEVTVSKPAVTEKGVNAPVGFAEQLNYMVTQLPKGFSDLKGTKKIRKEGELNLSDDWESKVSLEGSGRTYITTSRLGGATKLIADYGTFRSLAETEKVYKELARKVQEAKLPCCSLVQNETVHDNLASTYWLPFDLSGKMEAAGLKNMLIEVQWLKTLGFDQNFKTFDEYSVILRISYQ